MEGNVVMDAHKIGTPKALAAILTETERLGFTMASVPHAGSLLRTLARSKPGGAILELGTGTGVGTAWLLEGMDEYARLITIEKDQQRSEVAQAHLGNDPRVTFFVGDAAEVLPRIAEQRFDLIFADTWVGKFIYLDEVLELLKVGGLYINDDMMEQPNWPDDRAARESHLEKVRDVIAALEAKPDLSVTYLSWASGLIVAAKGTS